MGGVKKMSQTEGAQQGTNHSQDQLSMGGSQGYIFLDCWNSCTTIIVLIAYY